MQTPASLKSAERKAFQATFADGLWDVLIGCFALIFALAPLLSAGLGDFWSSAVFLPFWGLVYLAIWLTRKHIIAPRLGTVRFSKARQEKLRKLNLVMVSVNALALMAGIATFLAFDAFDKIPGGGVAGLLGLCLLVGFSAAAYFLDCPRLYFYGLLLFATPLVGEWLHAGYGAAHHGFPLAFGFAAGVMILAGLGMFARFLKNNPPVDSEGA